jgi:hypothetical protein
MTGEDKLPIMKSRRKMMSHSNKVLDQDLKLAHRASRFAEEEKLKA